MIETWVVSFTLILTRVGTFVALLPIFGGRNVPHLVKAGLTVALASLLFDPLAVTQGKEVIEGAGPTQWWTLALALGREALLGGLLGYAFGLFLVPIRIAGEYLGQEMGLALAGLLDPTAENTSSALTQLFEMLGTLIFFGLDGHHVFLAALHGTFTRWPIDGTLPSLPLMNLVSGVASVEEWGLLLVAPLGVCLFLASIVMALMARAAPQMNIWSVGFTLRLVVGLGAIFVLLPELMTGMVQVFGRVSEFVLRLV